MVVGSELRAVAQMPFTQVHRMVPTPLKQLGQGNFLGRQAHVFIGNQLVLSLGVVNGRMWLLRIRYTGDQFHELLWGRSELKAKACRISTGH